jgi:Fic family protein
MPAWNIMFNGEGHIIDADELFRQERQTAREQKTALRQAERKKIEQQRLDIALRIITENLGCINRSELTKKMEAVMNISRPTVSKFITRMVKEGKLFEANKYITSSPETVLPF